MADSQNPLEVCLVTDVRKPFKSCYINGVEKECMVDLGSDCTLMKESVARELDVTLYETERVLSAFNRTLVAPMACSTITFLIDNILFEVGVFVVADDQLTRDILIGRDVLGSPGVIASVDASGLTFSKHNARRVINEVSDINVIELVQREEIKINDVYCPGLDARDKTRLVELLNVYRKNVYFKIEEMGRANATVMKIELLSDEPVHHRPYRMSFSEREIVKEMVAELEACCIIRESHSPHTSPVILVKKKMVKSGCV